MIWFAAPVVAAAVTAALTSLLVLLGGRRPIPDTTDRDMELLARTADLAITPDVEPGLRAFFAKKQVTPPTWRFVVASSIFVACAVEAVVAMDAFTVYGRGLQTLELFTWVGVAMYSMWSGARPRSPAWEDAAVRQTHGRRTIIRDYVPPVTLSLIALATLWSVVLLTVLATVSHSTSDRWLAAGLGLSVLALESSAAATASLRLRRSRRRAHTVQQLAFDDALLSAALKDHLQQANLSIALICFVGIAGISSAPSWAGLTPVLWLSPFVVGLLRPIASARYYRTRLYPDAPATGPATDSTLERWADQLVHLVTARVRRGRPRPEGG